MKQRSEVESAVIEAVQLGWRLYVRDPELGISEAKAFLAESAAAGSIAGIAAAHSLLKRMGVGAEA